MRTTGLCIIMLCGVSLAAEPDMTRYQACADRLVKAINAADYEGIEREYNDQMLAALPLQKTREFFSGLTSQLGKLRELGKPHWEQDGWAVFPATFEQGTLDFKLSLDEAGKIAGMLFVPHAEKRAHRSPRYRQFQSAGMRGIVIKGDVGRARIPA